MQVKRSRTAPEVIAPQAAAAIPEEELTLEDGGLSAEWELAAQAAQDKQAVNLVALDIRELTTMADVFLICHGRNGRQNQTISDEIEVRLKKEANLRPMSVEGYTTAEWILMDYGDMIVHIFSEKAREYYDLDRLYRGATKMELPPDASNPS